MTRPCIVSFVLVCLGVLSVEHAARAEWSAGQVQAIETVASAQGCAAASVVCIDENGQLLPSESKAYGHSGVPAITPGHTLTVLVVGWSADVTKSRILVSFTVNATNASLENGTITASGVGPAPTMKAAARMPAAPGPAVSVPPAELLAKATSPSATSDDNYIEVSFDRAAPDTGSPDVVKTPLDRVFDVPVDPGRYYMDLGVMIPFTVDRKVVVTPNIATGERSLSLGYDLRIIPAFVVNVYPAGRLRSRLTTLSSPMKGRNWAGALGFQVGTGLGFTTHPFEEFYTGIIFTPVSGLSAAAGLALVNEQVFPASTGPGTILPAGSTFTPNTTWMPWPYFGVCATLDLLDILHAGVGKVAGTK